MNNSSLADQSIPPSSISFFDKLANIKVEDELRYPVGSVVKAVDAGTSAGIPVANCLPSTSAPLQKTEIGFPVAADLAQCDQVPDISLPHVANRSNNNCRITAWSADDADCKSSVSHESTPIEGTASTRPRMKRKRSVATFSASETDEVDLANDVAAAEQRVLKFVSPDLVNIPIGQLREYDDSKRLRQVDESHVLHFFALIKRGLFDVKLGYLSVNYCGEDGFTGTPRLGQTFYLLDGSHRLAAVLKFNGEAPDENAIRELPCRVFVNLPLADLPYFAVVNERRQRNHRPFDTADTVSVLRRLLPRKPPSVWARLTAAQVSKMSSTFNIKSSEVVRLLLSCSEDAWQHMALPILRGFSSGAISFDTSVTPETSALSFLTLEGRRDFHYQKFWFSALTAYRRDEQRCRQIVDDILQNKLTLKDSLQKFNDVTQPIVSYLKAHDKIGEGVTQATVISKLFGDRVVENPDKIFRDILRNNPGLARIRRSNFFAKFRETFEREQSTTVTLTLIDCSFPIEDAIFVLECGETGWSEVVARSSVHAVRSVLYFAVSTTTWEVEAAVPFAKDRVLQIGLVNPEPPLLQASILPDSLTPVCVFLYERDTGGACSLDELLWRFLQSSSRIASYMVDCQESIVNLWKPLLKPAADIFFYGDSLSQTRWEGIARSAGARFRVVTLSST